MQLGDFAVAFLGFWLILTARVLARPLWRLPEDAPTKTSKHPRAQGSYPDARAVSTTSRRVEGSTNAPVLPRRRP